jgi:peptidyl-prolyl cis-trans isomerase SurA
MSGTKMMRQARKHPFAAAALLCALAAGSVQAQAPAPAAAQPSTGGFLPPASASANVIDSIAVVVNDDIITRNELAARVRDVITRMKQSGASVPDEAALQRQVVERMIVERAQMQLAKEFGVRVDDGTVDRAISRIAEQQKMSVQELRNALEKEGTPLAKFREDIRNEIIVQRLREHEVDNKIQVSEAEIDSFLAAEKAAAVDRIEVNISQILIRIPENASPEQIAARKLRADEVLRQLRTGADFAKMAATYSDASDALQGGAIGWRDPRTLPPVFAEALAALKPGQATPAIRSTTGFHILKLVERRSAAENKEQQVQQQTRARHILIKVTPTMSAAEAKRKLAEMRERLVNKAAKFEDLARQFSGDSSAAKGGDLGWMAPGDIVPEFETVMNNMKPGELSDVVETPFGFHLIEVLERKADDQSRERERAAARMALRERKLVEAVEDWERQLRDRAYVEFRLEDK